VWLVFISGTQGVPDWTSLLKECGIIGHSGKGAGRDSRIEKSLVGCRCAENDSDAIAHTIFQEVCGHADPSPQAGQDWGSLIRDSRLRPWVVDARLDIARCREAFNRSSSFL